jgi:outer membrane protein TolC
MCTRPLLLLALLPLGRLAHAQDTLSVDRLQEAAVAGDPRTGQRALLRSATDLRVAAINTERLPQLAVNGFASHQSDVTRPNLGIAGIVVPDLPKDRWQTTLDITQRLYDGGELARRRELEEARHAESQADVTVALYALRAEVNSAFFSAFLLDKRAAEYDALVADLDARLAAVRARVDAGTALSREAAEIEAERVRASLQRSQAQASRRASLAILADLVGRSIDTSSVLVLPSAEPELAAAADSDTAISLRLRPEFDQFRQSRLRLDREAAYTTAENRPRLYAFGQAGLGLPGLDGFRTSSDAFWQAGVRVEWRPWTWRSAQRRAAAFRLEQDVLATEEQALSRRLARLVAVDLEEIRRLKQALADDERVVALRAEIERQARAQLDEGAITAAEYVETRTDVLEARLTLEQHRVELAQARANYLTTLGLDARRASETP